MLAGAAGQRQITVMAQNPTHTLGAVDAAVRYLEARGQVATAETVSKLIGIRESIVSAALEALKDVTRNGCPSEPAAGEQLSVTQSLVCRSLQEPQVCSSSRA